MRVYSEFNLLDFEAWSGGEDTKQTILDSGKEQEFEMLVEELFPDGASDTQVNDLLWFEDEWIFEFLGIEIEE